MLKVITLRAINWGEIEELYKLLFYFFILFQNLRNHNHFCKLPKCQDVFTCPCCGKHGEGPSMVPPVKVCARLTSAFHRMLELLLFLWEECSEQFIFSQFCIIT